MLSEQQNPALLLPRSHRCATGSMLRGRSYQAAVFSDQSLPAQGSVQIEGRHQWGLLHPLVEQDALHQTPQLAINYSQLLRLQSAD